MISNNYLWCPICSKVIDAARERGLMKLLKDACGKLVGYEFELLCSTCFEWGYAIAGEREREP